jgi:serine/threonine protein kinase
MSAALQCRSPEDLQRFLLGKLPAVDAEQVSQHLSRCSTCLNTVSGLEADDLLVQAMQAQARGTARPERNVVQGLIDKLSGLHRSNETSTGFETSPRSASPSASSVLTQQSYSFLSSPQANDEIGRLGGYRILKVLGAGGMGIVFEAEDSQLNRRVALKVMKPDLAADVSDRKRFLREARTMAAIEHDHIVTVHQVGEDGGMPFIAMQLLKGETLRDRMKRAREGDATAALSIAEIVRIAREVAEGLRAAHSQGLTHRDVKPTNIWLERGGRVKILDFGLARPLQDDAQLTQPGMIPGTPAFMSPEQAAGQPVDHLADLFSLGCVLYCLLTGRLPFNGPSTMAVLRALVLEQPEPPHKVESSVPRALSDLTMRLLAKDPQKRPQNAQEVIDALSKLERKRKAPTRKTKQAESPPIGRAKASGQGRRSAFFAAAAVALCFVPIGIWFSPAVYRFVTDQGVLVIQTNDPDVEVVVRQSGKQITIVDRRSGQEVNLKSGSYELSLSGNEKGLKLEADRLTLSRGGKEIVKVVRESKTDPTATEVTTPSSKAPAIATPVASASPTATATVAAPIAGSKTPFVVIANSNQQERSFATLADAATAAKSGDTIEIRGNGPFDCVPINFNDKTLTIRAASGFRPLLKFDADQHPSVHQLLFSASGILEGLDIELRRVAASSPGSFGAVGTSVGSLYMLNCRVRVIGAAPASPGDVIAVRLDRCQTCIIRNCEIYSRHEALIGPGWTRTSRLTLENNLFNGGRLIASMFVQPGEHHVSMRMLRNSARVNSVLLAGLRTTTFQAGHPNLEIESRGNIFECLINFTDFNFNVPDSVVPPSPREAESFIAQQLAWQNHANIYGRKIQNFVGAAGFNGINAYFEPTKKRLTLPDWEEFIGTSDPHSTQGQILFKGRGRLESRTAPDEITPEDFRLLPASAGYKAGEDGIDLGADLDLVGSGPAYEYFKRSPAYQEWLNETGQRVPHTEASERQAVGGELSVSPAAIQKPVRTSAVFPFVVIRQDQRPERSFGTLAEAVKGSQSGDTIEIRGNGPFDSTPIDLGAKALVIRAAASFKPVIRLNADANPKQEQLLTRAELVLEGVEFDLRRHTAKEGSPSVTVLRSERSPVLMTNCRFVVVGAATLPFSVFECPRCLIRNSEFLSTGYLGLAESCPPGSRIQIENNVVKGSTWLDASFRASGTPSAVIRLLKNSMRVATIISLKFQSPLQPNERTVEVDASDNIFDASYSAVDFALRPPAHDKQSPPLPEESERSVTKFASWNGRGNVYRSNIASFVNETPAANQAFKPSKTRRRLADWDEFWGRTEPTSVQGDVRMQGTDKLEARPFAAEGITAEDFRLLPGSTGYRAGAAGHDLGADVDLVGPGPAYERFKQTPAYQQWLKELTVSQ